MLDSPAGRTARSENRKADEVRAPHPENQRQGIWEARTARHLARRAAGRRHPGREWRQAMAGQLDGFAGHIRSRRWHDELIWDQLPAMRVIDENLPSREARY